MKSAIEYRNIILYGLAALLSLTSAGFALLDHTLPEAPRLEAAIVHGVTRYDRAALRASRPPYGVADAEGALAGPVVSLESLAGVPGIEDLHRERIGLWEVARPAADELTIAPSIHRARVSVINGRPRECRRSEDRYVCGEHSWEWVGPTTARVAGQEVTCTWAHPIDGKTLRVTYPSVLGGPFELQFALRDRAVGGGPPVDVEVDWAGQTHRHRHADRRGFSSLRLPKSDELTSLEVRVSAPRVGRRHFCYRIESP